MVSFKGLSLTGCKNISNKVREVLLLYAGQQIQSAIKGEHACGDSVSELIQPSKTTWVAGLEISVHELPALMELTAHLHSEPYSRGDEVQHFRKTILCRRSR